MKLLTVLLLLLTTIYFGQKKMNDPKYETATFASGCFWCTEAVFQRVKGVISQESGYTGGNTSNPTYEEVSSGTTGHAEAIQVTFDPDEISYVKLLEIFFSTHNPTTLNRQGADVGTQYRSEIFYHSAAQKEAAESIIVKLTEEKIFDSPIVTKVTEFYKFYKAEDYHQNYYNKNSDQPYCSYVITPKLKKFKKIFADALK